METDTLIAASQTGVLIAGLAAGTLNCALLVYNLARPGFGFWPAPDKSRWQHLTALTLFRVVCAALVLYALLAIVRSGGGTPLNYLLGLPVMAAAYGVTLWGYKSLGLENTYCGAEGLVTEGLYAYTRNPQYVSSVMAAIGLAITAGSWTVLGLTGVLFAVYALFALNEERFLVEHYGRAFLDYMSRTPRFIGLRSLEQAREDVGDLLAR